MNSVNMAPRVAVTDCNAVTCLIPLEGDDQDSHARRARAIIEAMTLEEKLSYITGVDSFCIRGIPRLGLPPIWMADATSGVRGVDAPITTFSCGVAMASSWNRSLIIEVANAIGHECRAVGISILLGPGVNIARIPTCGRNFEYMGEDPFLAGEIASSYVEGVQNAKVLPTIKHFACNNSEYDRHKTNVIVDERTLREIYLEAFRKVISSGGLALMSSYNQINGSYGSENNHLLEKVLREEWGFDGVVVSDWNSLYDTVGPVKHGVDIEMPKAKWMTPEKLTRLIGEGLIDVEDIEKKIFHILDTCSRMGILDRPITDCNAQMGSETIKSLALRLACEAPVLLKNDQNCLPITPETTKRIAIVGRHAKSLPSGGGGSSYILQNLPNKSLADGLKEELSQQVVIDTYTTHWYRSSVARKTVREADVVIVCTGYDNVYESEAYDRTWELPKNEAMGIKIACELNKRTIVVYSGGGAMETASWSAFPQAIVASMYLGEQAHRALARLLLGKVSFSGKLPFSIAENFTDYASGHHYPSDYAKISMVRIMKGQGDPTKRKVQDDPYAEQLMVGYRQFDTEQKNVRFCFGHGLSISEFSYRDLFAKWNEADLEVSCKIKNCGEYTAAEVVQLYIHDNAPKIVKADQELKGFEKVFLEPDEEVTVKFMLSVNDFGYFDVNAGTWNTDAGFYTIRIGSSSRDIRLSTKIEINRSLC